MPAWLRPRRRGLTPGQPPEPTRNTDTGTPPSLRSRCRDARRGHQGYATPADRAPTLADPSAHLPYRHRCPRHCDRQPGTGTGVRGRSRRRSAAPWREPGTAAGFRAGPASRALTHSDRMVMRNGPHNRAFRAPAGAITTGRRVRAGQGRCGGSGKSDYDKPGPRSVTHCDGLERSQPGNAPARRAPPGELPGPARETRMTNNPLGRPRSASCPPPGSGLG